MRWTWVALAFSVSCGNDAIPAGALPDAPPPGTPTVTVIAPRTNDAFYAGQSASITWQVTDDDDPTLTCDVAAVGAGAPIAISTATSTPSGVEQTTAWSLAGVAVAPTYQIEVTCRDPRGTVGTGRSGVFAVTAPPQPVSFASQIVPLFAASCTSAACHDGVQPQAGLDLRASSAYAELGGLSTQCPSTPLVKPGAPTESYLVHKLQGSGPCFQPTRMPKAATPFTEAQMQLVRDWIANGAPNN